MNVCFTTATNGYLSPYFSFLFNSLCRMTDVEKQPIPENMGGGSSDAAFAPPPYPTDSAFMPQPPPYMPSPYPYGPTVQPAYPPVPLDGNAPPPAQDIYIQGSPVGGAGTT